MADRCWQVGQIQTGWDHKNVVAQWQGTSSPSMGLYAVGPTDSNQQQTVWSKPNMLHWQLWQGKCYGYPMFLCKLNQLLPRTSAIHVTGETLVLHLCNGELALTLTIPILYSNLSGAQVIANNPQHFKRTKHINITHFFLQDEVADGWLTIAPIQSSENLADILTKPLTAPRLAYLQQLLGLTVWSVHCH